MSNLAVGVNRKISAASARTHTRKSRQTSSFRLPSGWFSLVFFYLFYSYYFCFWIFLYFSFSFKVVIVMFFEFMRPKCN